VTSVLKKNEISNNTFLVTGGAGFIGSHIVEFLLNNNAKKVRVLDSLITGDIKNIRSFESHSNFEFMQGDITKPADCEKACLSIDYISHQAALGSVPRSIENPLATHEANATGFLNILVAAKNNWVKRVVFASSSSVYGDLNESPKVENRIGKPLSPYAVSKLVNEQYAAIFATTYNMEIIGLRYFNIFGPRQNPNGAYAAAIPLFIQSLLNNEEVFINGDGQQSRDFTYVSNAVQANINALLTDNAEAKGKVFNIACGQSVSVNEMFELIANEISPGAKATHRGERFGDVKNSMADISLAKKYLDYEPGVLFSEGLKQTINWFKQ
jgi:UDP-N-acetylglucosamine/UDP-N-acetylgalactosamine 4-epimerase